MVNVNATEARAESGREIVRQEPTRGAPRYRPLVDIYELSDELRVVADMPGVKPEDIDIDFARGTLTIHGKVEQRQAEGTTYLLREYGVGDFYRVFQVSETIDAGRIDAEYHDGVLTLHLPKVERAKARKIEVRAG
jgi:HSP20 family protein